MKKKTKKINEDSLLFYRSFRDAIESLPIEMQLDVYKALLDYGFDGILPKKLGEMQKALFTLMRPQIDANFIKRKNGRKGGAPNGSNNNPNGRNGKKKLNDL